MMTDEGVFEAKHFGMTKSGKNKKIWKEGVREAVEEGYKESDPKKWKRALMLIPELKIPSKHTQS